MTNNNLEGFQFNFTHEGSFNNSEVLAYLEEVISMDIEEEYEYEAYTDIKWFGKVKSSSLKKIKRNMWKLHNDKF